MFWNRKKKKEVLNAIPYGDILTGRFPFVVPEDSGHNPSVFDILSNMYVPFHYVSDEDRPIKRVLSMSEYFKVPNDSNVSLNLKGKLLKIEKVDFDISDGIYLVYDIVTAINGIYSKERSRSHGFVHLVDLDKVGNVSFDDGVPVKDFRLFSEERKSYLQEYEFLAIYVKLPLIPVDKTYTFSTFEDGKEYHVPTVRDLFDLNRNDYNIGDIITVDKIHTDFVLVDDEGVKKWNMIIEKSKPDNQVTKTNKKEYEDKIPVYDEVSGTAIPTPGIISDIPITEYNFDKFILENGTMYWYKNGDKNFTYIYSKDKSRWIPYATFGHLNDKSLYNISYEGKTVFCYYDEERDAMIEILSGLRVPGDCNTEAILIDPTLYKSFMKDKVFTELSYTYLDQKYGFIDIIPEEGSGDNRGAITSKSDEIYILYMDNSEPAIHFVRGDNADIINKLYPLTSEYSILAVYVHI